MIKEERERDMKIFTKRKERCANAILSSCLKDEDTTTTNTTATTIYVTVLLDDIA